MDNSMRSDFLRVLEQTNACRMDGYIHQALSFALCVPDFCRKVLPKEIRYDEWCRLYGNGCVRYYADDLYYLRNNAIHELTPEFYKKGVLTTHVMLDFSELAQSEFPAWLIDCSLPPWYHTLNAGSVINDLIGSGYEFYQHADSKTCEKLDKIYRHVSFSVDDTIEKGTPTTIDIRRKKGDIQK